MFVLYFNQSKRHEQKTKVIITVTTVISINAKVLSSRRILEQMVTVVITEHAHRKSQGKHEIKKRKWELLTLDSFLIKLFHLGLFVWKSRNWILVSRKHFPEELWPLDF